MRIETSIRPGWVRQYGCGITLAFRGIAGGKYGSEVNEHECLRRKRIGWRVSNGAEQYDSGGGGHSGVAVRARGGARVPFRGTDVDAYRDFHAHLGRHSSQAATDDARRL